MTQPACMDLTMQARLIAGYRRNIAEFLCFIVAARFCPAMQHGHAGITGRRRHPLVLVKK